MRNLVAIYCRLSEEDRNKKDPNEDSRSIQNQKMMLTEYANNQGWEIYNIYSDDDYAGSDRNRPAFKRMIEDAKSRKFNIVLCKTQSRFTRELEIVEAYIHNLFPILGIRFVSVVDNIDTEIAGNKKTRQINGLINEWYLEDMSDSIRAALRARMKAGYFIGSFPPYGYKKDPEKKGHLIIDEEPAEVVREIFRLYNSGIGRTQIARILNERHIPSPSEYYRINKIKRNMVGKRDYAFWKYYTVSHILENEVYIGNLVQGRTHNLNYKSKHSVPSEKSNWVRIENTHEPIIDMDTWEITRKIWTSKSKPCYVGKVNKYSGILKCSKCGYNMIVAYNKHKRYYRCINAKYGNVCCTGTTVFESTLDSVLLDEISKIRDEYLNKEYVLKNSKSNTTAENKIASLKKTISSLYSRIQTLEKALKNLYIDKLQGIVSQGQFIELSRSFDDEKKECSERKAILEQELEDISSSQTDEKEREELLKKLISFQEITKELLNLFVEKIMVGGTKTNREINIFWKF